MKRRRKRTPFTRRPLGPSVTHAMRRLKQLQVEAFEARTNLRVGVTFADRAVFRQSPIGALALSCAQVNRSRHSQPLVSLAAVLRKAMLTGSTMAHRSNGVPRPGPHIDRLTGAPVSPLHRALAAWGALRSGGRAATFNFQLSTRGFRLTRSPAPIPSGSLPPSAHRGPRTGLEHLVE
jgi:hypothetical protein